MTKEELEDLQFTMSEYKYCPHELDNESLDLIEKLIMDKLKQLEQED